MNDVYILDCTLRDGGYCNNWIFGKKNISRIAEGLNNANIDIIECGFLVENIEYDSERTLFNSVEQIKQVIPQNREDKQFVAMINYGEYDVDKLPYCDGSSIDGIRVAFHKEKLLSAIKLCRQIKDKGYRVYVQPMVTFRYSKTELLGLIQYVNELEPYALYIVDSFGTMKRDDLLDVFDIINNNLDERVLVGFHSHNNMQLAYSNAQSLVELDMPRSLIIDSSIYGMGRGAGNLNTEMFVSYINEREKYKKYEIKPLLCVVDECINFFYQQNSWGYSLPNYISAVHNAHPNYAKHLDDKKTITVEDMDKIFSLMNEERKTMFDKNYIEGLYYEYMDSEKNKEKHQSELKKVLYGKKVILVAPGKSAYTQKELINKYSKENNTIVISVNFRYPYSDVNYIFISNIRRFKEIAKEDRKKCIITSNIQANDVLYITKYKDLINSSESVRDNAGMMAIKFLINHEVEEILLAGFDGYSHDVKENYINNEVSCITRDEVLDSMNEGIRNVLKIYSKEANIRFLTKPKHITI